MSQPKVDDLPNMIQITAIPKDIDDPIIDIIIHRNYLYEIFGSRIRRILLEPSVGFNGVILNDYLEFGSRSSVVARTVFHVRETLGRLVHSNNEIFLSVMDVAFETMESLAAIRSRINGVKKAESDAFDRVGSDLGVYWNIPRIIEFPKVSNLNSDAKFIINETARAIEIVSKIIKPISGVSLSKKTPPHNFSQWAKDLGKTQGRPNESSKFLYFNESNIHRIIEMRNILEHPKEGYKYELRDIRLDYDGNLCAPDIMVWHDIFGSPGPVDLLHFLESLFQTAMDLFENLLVCLVIDFPPTKFPYNCGLVLESGVDEARPFRFRCEIDVDKLGLE